MSLISLLQWCCLGNRLYISYLSMRVVVTIFFFSLGEKGIQPGFEPGPSECQSDALTN